MHLSFHFGGKTALLPSQILLFFNLVSVKPSNWCFPFERADTFLYYKSFPTWILGKKKKKKRKKLELIHQSSACVLKKRPLWGSLQHQLQWKPVPTAYITHWFLCLLKKKKKTTTTQPLMQKAIYGNITCTTDLPSLCSKPLDRMV